MKKGRRLGRLTAVLLCGAMLVGCAKAQDQKAEAARLDAAPALSFDGADPVESSLYVAPLEGITDDFIRGVDISSFLSEIESGVVYHDFEQNELSPAGFFELLAQAGVNCVRLRVWNDPYDKNGNSYGGGHNDLNAALEMGRWATEAGLQVLIDFHYSDFWADPSKQKSPKEWAHYTIEDKEQAIYDYTRGSIDTLLNAGINVTMVQIGNEVNNGMAGETDWDRICRLMSQGSQAVRDAAAEHEREIAIAVHFADPHTADFLSCAETLQNGNVDYDIFAVSYYPFWHGTLENLTQKLTDVADFYGKQVMVAETSYVYTLEDGDGQANSIGADTTGIELNYAISPQGQANAVRDVMLAVLNVMEAGIGVFYWEPAWIPVPAGDDLTGGDSEALLAERTALWEEHGSGWASSFAGSYDPNDAGKYFGGSSWDNQAMFDFSGSPLESLNVFRYVFGGTTAELGLLSFKDVSLEIGIGQKVQMPDTVPALLNSGEIIQAPVIWTESQVLSAEETGAGIYEIEGIVQSQELDYAYIGEDDSAAADENAFSVTCTLEIKKLNYIKNPGLEDADVGMWKIQGEGIGRVSDNNMLSGDYSLKFWSEKPVSYTVEQDITGIPAGTYELGAFLQGGDAGSNAVFQLYITVNGETQTVDTGVTSWRRWDNPVISDIQIPEGAQVTVGVKAEAAAGAWGAWDDFYLYEMDDQ